jgi:hypothetical protein
MRALIICLAGLAAASPLAAQQHHQHQHHAQAACPAGQACPMHDMSGAPMAAIMKFAPNLLLAQTKELALTDEQVSHLVVVRDAATKAVEQAGTGPMNHAGCIQASAALMAKALLTEAQREAVAKN